MSKKRDRVAMDKEDEEAGQQAIPSLQAHVVLRTIQGMGIDDLHLVQRELEGAMTRHWDARKHERSVYLTTEVLKVLESYPECTGFVVDTVVGREGGTLAVKSGRLEIFISKTGAIVGAVYDDGHYDKVAQVRYTRAEDAGELVFCPAHSQITLDPLDPVYPFGDIPLACRVARLMWKTCQHLVPDVDVNPYARRVEMAAADH